MTHEEFAAALAESAAQLAVGRWTFRACGTCIEVPVNGHRHIFATEISYRHYCAGPSAAERSCVVEQAAARLVAIVAGAADLDRCLEDWDWARRRVYLRLVSAVNEPPGAAPAARREWLPGLGIGYLVADAARGRLVGVTEKMLDVWGLAEGELYDIARDRLEQAPAPLRRLSKTADIYGFCCADGEAFLNALQILLPQQMERARAACGSDDLLIGIPEPQAGVVCARGGDAAGRMRRVIAAMHAEATVPLSADPLRWEAGRWSRPSALDR